MPFVPVSVLHGLVDAAEEGCVGVMVESDGRVQPLCAVYSRKMMPRLREELEAGRWKVRPAVDGAGQVKYLKLHIEKWFYNVNTPEEFARLSGD
jgi:molybdopterin-guanine dinucleotide biosynthesis protein A